MVEPKVNSIILWEDEYYQTFERKSSACLSEGCEMEHTLLPKKCLGIYRLCQLQNREDGKSVGFKVLKDIIL